MKMMRAVGRSGVFKIVWIASLGLGCAAGAVAQVSPNEILNPQLRALEKDYLPQLKAIHQEILKASFPFPFNLNRVVGLDPSQQIEADTRGLEFVRFRDRVTLKATG